MANRRALYLLDFALSLSCGGDEIQVQAQSDGAAVDCTLEVTGGREPTSKLSANKCGKAKLSPSLDRSTNLRSGGSRLGWRLNPSINAFSDRKQGRQHALITGVSAAEQV
jgi:hypothetical protein